MKSKKPYFLADGHLSDVGVAAWIESQNNQGTSNLPVQIEDHLEACLHCKELVIEVREAMDMIREEATPELQYEPEIRVIGVLDRMKKFPVLYRYAAAILIFLALGSIAGLMLWRTSPDTASLYAVNFSPYPDIVSVRGVMNNEDTANIILNEAFRLYDHNEFDSAVPVFRYLTEKFPASDTLRFYLAVTLLATGREFSEAITILRDPGMSGSIFREQALWYLSLAYLAENQVDSAIGHLNLLQRDSSDYKLKASTILDEIR
jgi:hypothetical protein